MRKQQFKYDAERLSEKYKSATHYILASLVPYTEANFKLSFSPTLFFNDLAKFDYIKQKERFAQGTLRSTYYRAVKAGLIEIQDDGTPKLTRKGQRKLGYFQPKLLKGNTRLLVVFDVPEQDRYKRDKLRLILKEFKFSQVQRSVWETKFDCREYVEMAIKEDGLQSYVILYEAVKIRSK